MNPRVTRATLWVIISICLLAASCQKSIKGDDVEPPGTPSPVEIRFKNLMGPFKNLVFDSTVNVGLSLLKISTFKYYISNVQFVNSNTGDTVKVPDTYFLIDHANPPSRAPQFMVPAGEYYGMSFLIGIDANRNFNGPKTGALDPALGMYWNATDGYIMAKLEGTSPSSTLPGNVFSYHVGGVIEPHSVLAIRHFKLGGSVSIQPNKRTIINISADALTWFNNPHSISFSVPCTGPGDLSNKIAENYYKMFNFISVTFE
ncbi:MAG TPA: MbnP family protein [Chitinophagaceae bacterium]|nr:MbnP family protein [Chitinophagaceae bacterium]